MCIRFIVINPTSGHQNIFEALCLELAKEYYLTILNIEEKRLPATISLVTISDLVIASPYFQYADILINPFSDRTIDKYISSKTRIVSPKEITKLGEARKIPYLIPEILFGFAIARYSKLPQILSLPHLDLKINQKEILKAFEIGYNFAKTQNFGFDIFPRASLSVNFEDLFLPGEEKNMVCLDCLKNYKTKTPELEAPQKSPSSQEREESSVKIEGEENSITIPIKIETD